MLAALALRSARLPLQAAGFDDSYFLLDYLLTDFGLWRSVSKGLPRQRRHFCCRRPSRFSPLSAREQGRPWKEWPPALAVAACYPCIWGGATRCARTTGAPRSAKPEERQRKTPKERRKRQKASKTSLRLQPRRFLRPQADLRRPSLRHWQARRKTTFEGSPAFRGTDRFPSGFRDSRSFASLRLLPPLSAAAFLSCKPDSASAFCYE